MGGGIVQSGVHWDESVAGELWPRQSLAAICNNGALKLYAGFKLRRSNARAPWPYAY